MKKSYPRTLLLLAALLTFAVNCKSDKKISTGGGGGGGSSVYCTVDSTTGKSDCIEDRFEPNDISTQATSVQLNTLYSATIHLDSYGIPSSDIFKFSLGPQDEVCTVHVSNITGGIKLSTTLFEGADMATEVTAYFPLSYQQEYTITTAVNPSLPLVLFFSDLWAFSSGNEGGYDFKVTCSAQPVDYCYYDPATTQNTCPDDAQEPNDTIDQAAPLNLDVTESLMISSTADVDFLKFTPGATDNFCRINIDNVYSQTNIRFNFYETISTVTPITVNNETSGKGESLNTTVVPGQDFFIAVSTSNSNGGYDITVSCASDFTNLPAICGNGLLEYLESCDDGDLNSGDGCDSACNIETGAVCGNGAIEAGEYCDDGNTANGDGCSASCLDEANQSESLSGAGYETGGTYNLIFNIPADATAVSIDSLWLAGDFLSPNEYSSVFADSCFLGNATSDADGNVLIEDTQFSDLFIDPACWTPGSPLTISFEATQDVNIAHGVGLLVKYAYQTNLTYWTFQCGDGNLEAGESCDDGNLIPYDGCSSSCQTTYTCGDSTIETVLGESCDDGNTNPGDGCSDACQTEACGNRTIDANETCDDGNTNPGDGCSSQCIAETLTSLSIVANTVIDGVLHTAHDAFHYSMDVTAGETYHVWWNDLSDGDATQTGDINVNIFDNVAGATLSGNINSGYTTPYQFTAANTGTVTIQVTVLYQWVENTGTFQIKAKHHVCGDGIIDLSENCDDSGVQNGDGCSSTCLFEAATPLAATFNQWYDGNIIANTDIAQYTIAANAGGLYMIRWNDSASGDGTQTGNIKVTATGETSGTIYFNAVGNGWTPQNFTSLIAENIIIKVEAQTTWSSADFGTYQLMVKLPACGDGYIDPNETCDDLNVTALDGCSDTCQIEAQALPADTWVDSTLDSAIPSRIFTFNAVAGEIYRISWNDAVEGDGTQTASITVTATDDVAGTNFFTDLWAAYLSPMKINIVNTGSVTLTINQDAAGSFQIIAMKAQCGDSIIDAAINEVCDDGNTATGDGCSATCSFEPFAGALDTFYEGSILTSIPGGIYSFPATAGTLYHLYWKDSLDGDGGQTVDVNVTATDAISGVDFLTNVDSGWSLPHSITAVNNGDITLSVAPKTAGNIGVYQVALFQAVCGDAILDTSLGEQCDDGNGTSNDGCSATCQIEYLNNLDFEAGIPAAIIGDPNALDWAIDSTIASTGVSSFKSGVIGNSQSSCFSIDITGGYGVSFDYKTDSENWDYLEFYLNGVRQNRWGGKTAWVTSAIYTLPAAGNSLVTDTVMWCYTKNATQAKGADTVWVDNIVY